MHRRLVYLRRENHRVPPARCRRCATGHRSPIVAHAGSACRFFVRGERSAPTGDHPRKQSAAFEAAWPRGCRTLRGRVLRWLPSWCLVSLLGSRREDRVPTRRGKTMGATVHGGDGNMAQKGRGIFMVYVDIDAQHVQEFNNWYNEEHLPELLSVPGILSAARYEAVKGGPQYLACYELESVAVMQTPAFTNRPRTPWGQKVSPSVIGKNLTRIVGEQIYPDGVEMPERGMAPVLQIGRMSVPAEIDAEWNAWYSREYVPGYRKVPGVIYARRYRVLEGTSSYSTVYEFASTAVPESPEWKEQQQHSSPNSPRMRQAMTHAPGSAGVYVRVNP